jgi:uncharacterized protein YbjT (DUF2867 family)
VTDLVAIAGATGNAGLEVVRAAHARGLRVRALVRNEDKLAPVRDCVAEVRNIQVTERESLRGALDGAAYVVTALGKTRQTDRVSRRAVDVDANANLFDESRVAGVGRIAMVSVFGADPDSSVSMLRMKGDAETALRECGVPHVVIRPTGFFSDMWEVFQMASRGSLWTVGSGATRMNPISLPDLGRFIVDSLLDDAQVGKALPIGGPDMITWRELGDMCGRVLGKPVKTRALPMWLAKGGIAMIRPFSRNRWELAQFIVGSVKLMDDLSDDELPPCFGVEHLEDYFSARHDAHEDIAT